MSIEASDTLLSCAANLDLTEIFDIYHYDIRFNAFLFIMTRIFFYLVRSGVTVRAIDQTLLFRYCFDIVVVSNFIENIFRCYSMCYS